MRDTRTSFFPGQQVAIFTPGASFWQTQMILPPNDCPLPIHDLSMPKLVHCKVSVWL